MSDHPINNMMDTTLEKIKSMVDAKTVIGDPIIAPDGTMIIPVSKISYGFASGGSDLPSKYSKESSDFFGGGSGAGVSITPVAFLTISNGNVKLVPIQNNDGSVEKIIDKTPEAIGKIVDIFKKEKKQGNKDISIEDPIV